MTWIWVIISIWLSRPARELPTAIGAVYYIRKHMSIRSRKLHGEGYIYDLPACTESAELSARKAVKAEKRMMETYM